nr:hypothetical protein [uncultured Pseudogulbenkiania sp.]
MAQLHPQECFLLERYTSLEYIGELRDTWREVVRLHEQALDDYMRQAPADLRSRHLSEQPDVSWGTVVLPNFRSTLQKLMNAFIYRSHDDPRAFRIGGGVGYDLHKGAVEYWDGWISQDLLDQIGPCESKASKMDSNIQATNQGLWGEGDLTYLCEEVHRHGSDLPNRIPAYELDHSVVIRPGDPVLVTGLYLPDVDNACAQFLHPYRTNQLSPDSLKEKGMREIEVFQGVQKDEDGYWEERQRVIPTWTLIRRVSDRYIAVPQEGFYSKDKPSTGRVEAGHPCPQAGLWWTPAKPDARRACAQGEVMPDFPNSRYGATIWYREAE